MQKLLFLIYNSKKLSLFLKILSHAISLLSVFAYGYIIFLGCKESIPTLIKLLIFSAAPFVIVSIARRLINSKRPYEVYGFYESKPKEKAGRSFPSRHIFSAFLIATLMCIYSPILAAVLFMLGAILAASRVLLGIHFISDVVFGALIGILSGALAILFI